MKKSIKCTKQKSSRVFKAKEKRIRIEQLKTDILTTAKVL